MDSSLSFAIQLILLTLLLAGAAVVIDLALRRDGPGRIAAARAAGPAPSGQAPWIITLESSLLPQPTQVHLSGNQNAVEFGGSGYPLPSRALVGVRLRFRRDPERNGLSVETESRDLRIGTTRIEDFKNPYVVDRDEIKFTADDSFKMVFTRVDAS